MDIPDQTAFLLVEYWKLKDEQIKRIEMRDHLMYLTLVAVGTVFAFAIQNADHAIAFLVLPFICMVLGWSSLVNDEKVSAIGRYLRENLIPTLKTWGGQQNSNTNWEWFHLRESKRTEVKSIQFLVDLFVYCLSGIVGTVCFFVLSVPDSFWIVMAAVIESALLVVLAIQFYRFSPLSKRVQ